MFHIRSQEKSPLRAPSSPKGPPKGLKEITFFIPAFAAAGMAPRAAALRSLQKCLILQAIHLVIFKTDNEIVFLL
jgi:hypothetical protein